MIFVVAATEPTVFLMLSEQDVANMRGGRTVYVDRSQMQGHKFNKVILSLHKSNDAALEILNQAGHLKGKEVVAPPEPQPMREVVCSGCKGNMAIGLVFEGKCAMCWRETARHYETLCKGQW